MISEGVASNTWLDRSSEGKGVGGAGTYNASRYVDRGGGQITGSHSTPLHSHRRLLAADDDAKHCGGDGALIRSHNHDTSMSFSLPNSEPLFSNIDMIDPPPPPPSRLNDHDDHVLIGR